VSRKRRIRPEALVELREAAEWYEEQRPGLGGDLVEEFETTLDEALCNLERGPVVARTSGGRAIRRFRLKRFARYAVYLLEVDDVVHVVAFEHSSREPGYWRDRLK